MGVTRLNESENAKDEDKAHFKENLKNGELALWLKRVVAST